MTQKERVLKAILDAGQNGIRPEQFLAPNVCDGGKPILRLAARVLDLKNEGHEIACRVDRVSSTAIYTLKGETLAVTPSQVSGRGVVMRSPLTAVGGSDLESPEGPLGLFDSNEFTPPLDYYGAAA